MNEIGTGLQDSIPKRPVFHGALGSKKGKRTVSVRFSVRITSFRRRLIDPDNLCGKYVLDSLRYAGVLRDDTAQDVEYSIRQIKVLTPEEERTEVEVEALV